MHNGVCFLQMRALQKNHGHKMHLHILRAFTPSDWYFGGPQDAVSINQPIEIYPDAHGGEGSDAARCGPAETGAQVADKGCLSFN